MTWNDIYPAIEIDNIVYTIITYRDIYITLNNKNYNISKIISSVGKEEVVSFNDNLYNKLIDNPSFYQADQKLNTVWGIIKKQVSKKKYDEIKKSQDNWLSIDRDKIANEYMKSMSIENAFTKATYDRIKELTEIISSTPKNNEYTYTDNSSEGNMIVNNNGKTINITVSTVSDSGYTCDFSGRLVDKDNDGWFESENSDDGISILFMKDSIRLIDFGHAYCGMSASMEGEYIIQK